ncbi:hypothetical protein WR25_11785 [Diploscapter pachys]|uniref:Uncharacterized protein n=1 Tax=Diploscapter pachys TaxID=2018661 RepID=A0A2A2J8Q7_9BILA|nr:hypothetical protein WR25_11785 [Diploscapter pachys]
MPRTSTVRERVLAIEKGQASENTIIRARYLPDVKGVNRPNLDQPSGSSDDTKISNLPYLIRPGTIHYIGDQQSLQNSVEKIRKTPRVHLPQLEQSVTVGATSASSCNGGFGITKKMRKAMEIVDQIDRQTSRSDETLMSSDSSDPHLSGIGVAIKLQKMPKRTFAQLGVRQNGAILNQPLSTLSVGLPNRSISDQHLEAKSEGQQLSVREIIPRSQSSKDTRVILPRSTKSVEAADLQGRATQTDSVPLVIIPRRKSDMPIKMDDIEEREALFGVIEDALGETFDRYSRVRMNQIIANSARKQVIIFRPPGRT